MTLVHIEEGRVTELAGIINREHSLAYRAALDALEHAILCGEALIEARERVAEGSWLKWVDDNLNISTGTLHRYVRLATYKDHLLSAERQPKSINAAIGYLKAIEIPAASVGRNGRKPTFDVEEAKRLRSQGMTYEQIGSIVGVSDQAVRLQLIPGAQRKAMVYTSRHKKKRLAERRALEQAQRDKKVAKVGGAAAGAYALLRRCCVAIDQAMIETTNDSERKSLRDALAQAHKAEDAIVQALRLERTVR